MDFKTWLEEQLSKPIPQGVVAFNFNLYECSEENEFDAQLVGCPSFDEEDPDWACSAIFSSEEDLYHFSSEDWETALDEFKNTVKAYLSSTQEHNPLTDCKLIYLGFVDGDLIPIRTV